MGNYIKGIQWETNQDIGHTLASIWSPNEDSLKVPEHSLYTVNLVSYDIRETIEN